MKQITEGNVGLSRRLRNKDKVIVAAIVTAMLVMLGALVGLLTFQNGIRGYRNQIRFLDPSWMCVTEHEGSKVVLAGDNQRKLLNVLERCSRKVVCGEPQIVDTVSFTFTKDGSKWVMDISQTDQDCLKMDLVGEKEYHVYIPEENYFETIVELCGPEGKGTPNKVLAGREEL